MLTLENGSQRCQPISVFSLMEFEKAKPNPEVLDSLDLESLLMLQDLSEREEMLAKEFEDTRQLTRAPVQVRLRNLIEERFADRKVKPGTETKYRPTYVYSLSPWITLEQIKAAIERKANRSSQIKSQEPKKQTRESKDMHQEISGYTNQMQVMAELLEAAIDRIADLESRLSRLEQGSVSAITLNRDELLRKLQSGK
ncbi:hypothetical protein K9N68_38220 (plasmid) [Kovacikia minuta CCNUW1]|uniref:hypothetical protein n=1 Tax=Kovacikia minuta TaxID=2931930 RepID=UPI001CCB9393|nr:hypothetical protein [Kovacikia minuta]UBF30038.1 hypothetical protein K9N68_38220 [Kovacikia minuta CCNUW1]